MKQLLKLYWYIKFFFGKHGKLIGIVMIAGIIFFTSLSALFPSIPKPKKTLYIGRVGTYTLTTLPSDIQQLISLGLTTVDVHGNISPSLAERWSVEHDGRAYRFILKKNIFWQDGKILIPTDIGYGFSDVEVSTTPNEIVFTLKDPFSAFPSVVSQPLYRVVQNRVLFIFPSQTILGLGEYRVMDIKLQNDSIQELALDGTNESRVYRFYQTENRAVIAYKRGEVDRLEGLSGIQDFSGWSTVKTTSTMHTDQYLGVFFNTSFPLLSKEIRQALNYATQKPADDIRAIGPIDSQSWAYNATVRRYDMDLQKAVSILTKTSPDTPINLELTTTPVFQQEASALIDQWQTLGLRTEQACKTGAKGGDAGKCSNYHITVSLKLTNFPDVQNYQVLLIGQQIPKDPDQYFLFHSTQPTNITHYKSPRIDKLLEDGRKETTQNERLVTYQDFQQFLVEDSPIIFLKHLTTYSVERKPLFSK